MKEHSLVRTIYLYLFALVGLACVVIGSVLFVNMALKAFVFTKAEEEERLIYLQPPYPPISLTEIEGKKEEIALSEEEKAQITQWLADYKNWQERGKVDYVVAQRHRNASLNLALIVIGLPLYLYHWRLIKKETSKKED